MIDQAGTERRIGPPAGPDEYPAGIVLVTAAAGGRRNVMAANRITCVSPEPMTFALSVCHERYTYGLIKESGEFVLNCVTRQMAAITMRAGMESGRDLDKFAAYGLQTKSATHVAAPLIVGCSSNIECKVIDTLEVGDRTLFIARQLALHTDEGKLPLLSFQHKFYEIGAQVPVFPRP